MFQRIFLLFKSIGSKVFQNKKKESSADVADIEQIIELHVRASIRKKS
jgi:hypothetical protein